MSPAAIPSTQRQPRQGSTASHPPAAPHQTWSCRSTTSRASSPAARQQSVKQLAHWSGGRRAGGPEGEVVRGRQALALAALAAILRYPPDLITGPAPALLTSPQRPRRASSSLIGWLYRGKRVVAAHCNGRRERGPSAGSLAERLTCRAPCHMLTPVAGMPGSSPPRLRAAVELGATGAVLRLLRAGRHGALGLRAGAAAGAAGRRIHPGEERLLEPAQQFLGQGCGQRGRSREAGRQVGERRGGGAKAVYHQVAARGAGRQVAAASIHAAAAAHRPTVLLCQRRLLPHGRADRGCLVRRRRQRLQRHDRQGAGLCHLVLILLRLAGRVFHKPDEALLPRLPAAEVVLGCGPLGGGGGVLLGLRAAVGWAR